MSKLSNSKQKVWDRLKNGIQEIEKHETVEMTISRHMAREIANEIDKEILAELSRISFKFR